MISNLVGFYFSLFGFYGIKIKYEASVVVFQLFFGQVNVETVFLCFHSLLIKIFLF